MLLKGVHFTTPQNTYCDLRGVGTTLFSGKPNYMIVTWILLGKRHFWWSFHTRLPNTPSESSFSFMLFFLRIGKHLIGTPWVKVRRSLTIRLEPVGSECILEDLTYKIWTTYFTHKTTIFDQFDLILTRLCLIYISPGLFFLFLFVFFPYCLLAPRDMTLKWRNTTTFWPPIQSTNDTLFRPQNLNLENESPDWLFEDFLFLLTKWHFFDSKNGCFVREFWYFQLVVTFHGYIPLRSSLLWFVLFCEGKLVIWGGSLHSLSCPFWSRIR